nr:sigma-54 dependent transcriptional regulator [Marinibactrum halimedae]
MFVDDEPQILRALERGMATLPCQIMLAESGEQALEIMSQQPADIIISDMRMPGMSGDELLSRIAEDYPETVRMVLTGYAEMSSVLKAVNEGHIWGYMSKPWNEEQLIISLEQAIYTQRILAEYSLLRRNMESYERQFRERFEGFIGSSVAMEFVYKSIEQCAPSHASVFITGPTGSGKEVTAAAIHNLSPRKNKPFLAINCAAIPHELMESEIFGHIKGAFSGAISNRQGAASLAHGGTLFLDELGEMDISLQAKLLRFIQTGCFQKVGSEKVEKVDIRFIAATNRDPLDAIQDKQLREDLYYRLNVISIHLPPLCERDKDALLIARNNLDKYSTQEGKVFIGIEENAENLIVNYPWPGNVRQLINTIHSAVIMSEGPLLSLQALGFALKLSNEELQQYSKRPLRKAPIQPISQPTNSPPSLSAESSSNGNTHDVTLNSNFDGSNLDKSCIDRSNIILPLAEVEKIAIERAISLCDGNVVKAAGELKVSPSTLYRKIQNWQTTA